MSLAGGWGGQEWWRCPVGKRSSQGSESHHRLHLPSVGPQSTRLPSWCMEGPLGRWGGEARIGFSLRLFIL